MDGGAGGELGAAEGAVGGRGELGVGEEILRAFPWSTSTIVPPQRQLK